MMTMGSLFDGIGGFPLAARRNGIATLWASEIEPSSAWSIFFGGVAYFLGREAPFR